MTAPRLIRDTSTPERADFWAHVRAVAAEVRERPAWQRKGVAVDPRHFETYGPEDHEDRP